MLLSSIWRQKLTRVFCTYIGMWVASCWIGNVHKWSVYTSMGREHSGLYSIGISNDKVKLDGNVTIVMFFISM